MRRCRRQELLRAGMGKDICSHTVTNNSRVLAAFRGRIRLGVLPVSVLMTGRSYCLQRLDRVMRIPAFLGSRYLF